MVQPAAEVLVESGCFLEHFFHTKWTTFLIPQRRHVPGADGLVERRCIVEHFFHKLDARNVPSAKRLVEIPSLIEHPSHVGDRCRIPTADTVARKVKDFHQQLPRIEKKDIGSYKNFAEFVLVVDEALAKAKATQQ